MFVTFQYYCICWMSKLPPEWKENIIKIMMTVSLNVLSWQDSETRPGEFVIFMLSIILEKEYFEVNCLYKTRWDSYPGIAIRWGKKIIFIKKKWPNFLLTFSFLLNIKKQHTESIIYTCHHSECEKTGHIFNRNKLWGFQ